MNFKESLEADIDIFMNLDEFGEIHIIDGQKMLAIIDNNELEERSKAYKEEISMGVFRKHILMYVRESEFGPLPYIGRQIELDGEYYTVANAIKEGGIHSITLTANHS